MGQIEIINNTQAVVTREFSRDEMAVIKDVIARGATDTELKMFVQMAQKLGLDPLSRQIHCVKRRARLADGTYGDAMTITVGIDGYRLVADRTGRYCPGRAPTYEYDDDGNVESATAYVLKLAGGAWHEVSAVAFWDEYAQTTKEGQPTAMWAKMPRLMLAKCAEALALRRAFPAELSGVYTDDEMQQAQSEALAAIAPAPQIAAPVAAPAKAPKAGGVGDAAWKVEIATLGKKAASILESVPDLPAEQRKALEDAAQAARDVYAANGHSTQAERTAAVDGLKKAIGIPA